VSAMVQESRSATVPYARRVRVAESDFCTLTPLLDTVHIYLPLTRACTSRV